MDRSDFNITTQTGVRKIFINNIDSYHGKYISEYLSKCTIGSTKQFQDDSSDADVVLSDAPSCYQILGTVANSNSIIKPNITGIYPDDRNDFYACVLASDVIIYDITEDSSQIHEAEYIITKLHDELNNTENLKFRVFILVSSIMTWTQTQPLDKDEPDIPFSEEDFRKRKSHSNYKNHIALEKLVTKLGRTNVSCLSTYVVASGLIYGIGEGIFHYLFKAAWLNNPELPIYGEGNNIIPTIHLHDLAQVLQNISDQPPTCHYLIAVDNSNNTFKKIIKAISKVLSNGKIKQLENDSIFLERSLTQTDIDQLRVDLIMEAVYIKEKMNITWRAEDGIVENIMLVKDEYIKYRGLQPIKVMISGPPASGKTTVAEQLAIILKLHHIKVKDVIEGTVEFMRNFVKENKALAKKRAMLNYEDSDDEDSLADEANKIKTYKLLLEQVEEVQNENNWRMDDALLIELYQICLQSKPCQNQGFILDGFPKTNIQAKLLFDSEEDNGDEDKPSYKEDIMPQFIFNLQADDKFLQERVINLPQCIVHGTHNEMEAYVKRLAQYRALNTEADTVLNYFDELEIHPENIDITGDNSIAMSDTVNLLASKLPKGRNYGPTEEEKERQKRNELNQNYAQKLSEEQMRNEQEFLEAEEKRLNEEAWAKKRELMEQEEKEMLHIKSAPMRHYLMQNVMPTLCNALQECVLLRPDDPIDFLAEYIFKNNPQEI